MQPWPGLPGPVQMQVRKQVKPKQVPTSGSQVCAFGFVGAYASTVPRCSRSGGAGSSVSTASLSDYLPGNGNTGRLSCPSRSTAATPKK